MCVRCLDDDTIDRLVRGELEGAKLDGVDEHLDGCASCQRLVAALVETTGETGDRPELLPKGASLDRFVVLETVGVGAMGAVYAAFDPRLDRRVALKLLHARSGDPEARSRLLREARAMARLAHPNVVRVYDAGEARIGEADGTGSAEPHVFVAMELVEGTSLRGWLAAEKRSPETILAAFAAAGRGLEAAHAAGLVHRDFKPDNVLVGADGGVRVGDFGLAASGAGTAALPESAALDRTGAVVGTPVYMAPEQIDGARADARADQFSFAVALFEALDGARPFSGASLAELRESIAGGPPARSWKDVPSRAVRAMRRALSVDPEARFHSMGELLRELEPPPRRPIAPWAIAGGAVLVVAGALGLSSSSAAPCTGGADAIAEVWNAERRERIASALEEAAPSYGRDAAGAIVSVLDAWAEGWAGAHDGVCRATRIDGVASEALLDVRLACLSRARASVDALSRRLGASGLDPAEASVSMRDLPDVEACVDLASETDRPPPPPSLRAEVASIEEDLDSASADLLAGDVAGAAVRATALLARAEATGWAPVRAEAGLLSARASRAAGLLADAGSVAASATLVAEESGEPRILARLWAIRAAIAGERGDADLAVSDAEHAEAVLARAGRPPVLEARVRVTLATALSARGEPEEARHMLEDALSSAESADDRDATSAALTELGNLARERGDLDEALSRHESALALDREALGPRHPAIGRHLHNVAGIHRLRGELDEAEATYREALAIRIEALGEMHPEVGLTENSLGLVAEARHDTAAAREHFERAIERLAGHAEEGLALRNLGLLELGTGDLAAARPWLERAADRLAETHGPLDRARALVPLAEAELGVDRDAAERHARSALPGLDDPDLRARADAILGAGGTSIAPPPFRGRAPGRAHGAAVVAELPIDGAPVRAVPDPAPEPPLPAAEPPVPEREPARPSAPAEEDGVGTYAPSRSWGNP